MVKLVEKLREKVSSLNERQRLKRGEIRLTELDLINCDYFLGREADQVIGKSVPETVWARAHARVVEDLREDPEEKPMGYAYVREGKTLCMAGLAKPHLATSNGNEQQMLDNLVKDTPFTTLVSKDGEIPKNQAERKQYFAERMKKVKKVIIVMGGLLENRLAMEGIADEILQAQENKEEVAVIVLTHSGGERSYQEGAELAKVNPAVETSIIKTSIKRILQLYQLTPEQVVGLVGHSKGGWFVEQILNSKYKDSEEFVYPNAAGVEIAMVPMGTRLSKKKKEWSKYRWFVKNFEEVAGREQAVKIQNQDILARIVDLAIKFPDMQVRETAIGIVGKWVAEYYVGKKAAYKEEAIAQIVHELMYNRKAIWAQQRSLARMGMIVEDFEKTSPNYRLIFSAIDDNTLEELHERAYKHARYQYDKDQGRDVSHEMGLTSDAERLAIDSEHNPSKHVVAVLAKWLNEVVNNKIQRTQSPQAFVFETREELKVPA